MIKKKPNWIRVKFPKGKNFNKILNLVTKNNLNTICQSGNCPNIAECWGDGVATFMILGNICTRSCGFCAVKTGKPKIVDLDESMKIAKSIKIMNIKHAVITSVNRDDLTDKGSLIWAKTIDVVKKVNPQVTIETLIPDFQGQSFLIDRIIDKKPEVISHNLETVERLTKKVRIQAKYKISLKVLEYIKTRTHIITKTGIMLGLGELDREVIKTMEDARKIGVDVFTIGQYLSPSSHHLPVYSFVDPNKFVFLRKIGLEMGFKHVESGPLVRSSYHADRHVN